MTPIEFARKRGSKDKRKRRRRNLAIAGGLTLAGLAGAGFAGRTYLRTRKKGVSLEKPPKTTTPRSAVEKSIFNKKYSQKDKRSVDALLQREARGLDVPVAMQKNFLKATGKERKKRFERVRKSALRGTEKVAGRSSRKGRVKRRGPKNGK